MGSMRGVIIAVAAAVFIASGAARPGNADWFAAPDFASAEKLYKDGKYKEAFSAMKQLAGSNPGAKRMLAAMYLKGEGTQADGEKALKLYQEAAATGDAQAQYELGDFYQNRSTNEPNPLAKAYELYKSAAQQGQPQAQYRIGKWYLQSDGVPALGIKRDWEAAFEWLRKAAQGGDLHAQLDLAYHLDEQGMGYEDGAGRWGKVPKDPAKGLKLREEAAEWYQRAVENGSVDSMGSLARLYDKMNRGKLSVYWAVKYAEAARQKEDIRKSADIMFWKYFRGSRDKPDLLSEKDHKARWEFYAQNAGVQPDPLEAYRWLLIAKAHGEEYRDILEELRAKIPLAELARVEEAAKNWKPGQKVVIAEKPYKPLRKTAPSQPAAPVREPAPAVQAVAAEPDQDPALPPPLSPAFSLKESANDFALVIGIEGYKSAPMAKYAERDAVSVRNYLRAMGYPERNIIHLSGADASLSGILSYLEEWLPKNIGPESRLFVFFSGHGAPDPTSADPYLVPWDGKLSYLKTTALPLSRFYRDLEGLKAKNILVAMDACFSGSGARSALMAGARPLVAVRPHPAGLPPGMAVLASSSGAEISVMHESAGHGLFTYHLLKALDGPLAQGRPLTAGGVFDELAPKVSDGARRVNGEQTPQLEGNRTVPLY